MSNHAIAGWLSISANEFYLGENDNTFHCNEWKKELSSVCWCCWTYYIRKCHYNWAIQLNSKKSQAPATLYLTTSFYYIYTNISEFIMVNAKCYSIFYEHFSVIWYGKQKLCNGKVHVIALHTFIFNPWHLFFYFCFIIASKTDTSRIRPYGRS